MAGRFVIRRDHRNGTFCYLARNYNNRFLSKKDWTIVTTPGQATRFWNRDSAEAAIFVLAVKDLEWGYSYSVREWDGSSTRNP
jgi:hypothetical protein